MWRLAVLVFLAVCCLLRCGLSSAQPTFLSQVVITSVTGCTDVWPITVNCSVPANVSIHTSGVGSLLYQTTALLLIDYDGGRNNVPLSLDTSDPTNSTLWALVRPGAYSPQWIGTVLNVSVYAAGSASAPAPAFTFAAEPDPVISSISGCTGSGQATTGCSPDSAVLTIQGTGIGWLASSLMQLVIGSNVMTARLANVQAVNATFATLSLASIYYGLLFPEHYNGVLLPLYFQSTTYQRGAPALVIKTNAVSISFVPLPPPLFTLVSTTVCDARSGGLANYTGCLPGTSAVSVRGHYLYGLSLTVGAGVPCVVSYSDADSFTCNPAVGAGLLPNMAYSITASNELGSFTAPSFVSFSAQPSLAYVVACSSTQVYTTTPSVYNYQYPACQPGATITIRGSQFVLGDQTVQANILVNRYSSSYVSANLSCSSPVVVDSSTVTCVLPTAIDTSGQAVYGSTVYLRLGFNSSSVWTNTLNSILLRSPQAPTITGLSSSGCGPTSTSTVYPGAPLQVSSCVSNATLTLTGVDFNGTVTSTYALAYTAVQQSTSTMATVLNSSSTQILLQLPDPENPPTDPIVLDAVYQYVLTLGAPNYARTNVFLVSFAASPTPSTSPSSTSSSLSSGAIAGVVLAGVAAAAGCAVLALVATRRVRAKRSSGGGDSDGFSSLRSSRLHEDSGRAEMKAVELQ